MSAVSVLHAPRDEALGEKIAAALLRQGHSARRLFGDDAAAGDLPLEDAAAIVIWSAAAEKLVRLHAQAREALNRGALIPVTVGGAPAPSGFEALQPVDLSGWGGDENDPRWRFVLEEINLASRRNLLEDGAVWARPEGPVEAAGAAPAAPRSSEAPPGEEPIEVEASYAVSVDRYWPETEAKKSFRFSLGQVALGGGVALIGLTFAAMIFGPKLLPSPDGAGPPSLAFVQPAEPVEKAAAASETPKPQSDFEVTAYRDAAAAEKAGADAAEAAPDTDDLAENAASPDDIETVSVLSPDVARGAGATPAENAEGTNAATADAPVIKPEQVAAVETKDAADKTATAPNEGAEPAANDDAMAGLMASVTLNDAEREAMAAPKTLPEDVTKRIQLGNYFKDCADCPDMASLPAGSFRFGSPENEPTRQDTEGPVTDVTLAKPFAIATREVTFKEWDACVADGGCRAYKPSDLGWGRADRPVVNVSYEDAQAYVAWLSAKTGDHYRLPSEEEWEFAARGGTSTPFSFGAGPTTDEANYDGDYPYIGPKGVFRKKTTPVASFPPNNFGLFDMHGNVWEWTQDCWRDSHTGAPKNGAPVGAGACSSRVIKGGAWNTGGWRLRSAHRVEKHAEARENDIGFRVARDLD